MKIVFFGTPEFAVPSLRKLRESNHELLAVFSQPDKPSGRGLSVQPTPVRAFARRHGLPVYQPDKIKNNEQMRDLLAALRPDIIVVAAYGKILPKWLLDLPRYGAINVHASLLPKYRGAAPIHWAIINGEKHTGITIMQMEEQLDTGDILIQRAVDINPDETAGDLHDQLSVLGAELLCTALEAIEKGTVKPIKQDPALATFAPMIDRAIGKIDWRRRSDAIHNLIRGVNPWPGAYTIFKGETLHVWKSRPVAEAPEIGNHKPEVGEVIRVDPNGVVVQCGESTFLSLLEFQRPNRKRLPVGDFINGVKIRVGDRLCWS